MFEKLNDEKIIVDITNLVNNCENIENDLDAYCQFMKGIILSTSGLN